MQLWINKIGSTLGQTIDSKTKSLPPPEKRTATSGSSSSVVSGGAGTTSSLRKDFTKK